MAMQTVKTYVEQEGICISKEYKEPRASRTDANGKIWPATEEKYIIKVVSCSARYFSEETGMSSPLVLEYSVDKATFDKIKFDTWPKARVGFNVQTYGSDIRYIPEYFALIGNK